MTTATAPPEPTTVPAIKVRIVIPVALRDHDGGLDTRRNIGAIIGTLAAVQGYEWTVTQRPDQGVIIEALYSTVANELGGLEAAAYALEEVRRLLDKAIGSAPKAGKPVAALLRRTRAGITVRTAFVKAVAR